MPPYRTSGCIYASLPYLRVYIYLPGCVQGVCLPGCVYRVYASLTPVSLLGYTSAHHHPFHCWSMPQPPVLFPFHCWSMLQPPVLLPVSLLADALASVLLPVSLLVLYSRFPFLHPFHCWARRREGGYSHHTTRVGRVSQQYSPRSRS